MLRNELVMHMVESKALDYDPRTHHLEVRDFLHIWDTETEMIGLKLAKKVMELPNQDRHRHSHHKNDRILKNTISILNKFRLIMYNYGNTGKILLCWCKKNFFDMS